VPIAKCVSDIRHTTPNRPHVPPQFHDPQGFTPTSSMTSVTFAGWFAGVICLT
jgi:hypothetical protein